MSDIQGSQDTQKTKFELDIEAKIDKGFSDVESILKNMNAWIDTAIDAFDQLEKKIDNVGKTATKVNNQTGGFSATSFTKDKNKNKTGSKLTNIPTDHTTPAGQAGIEILKSQKQLLDSQKDLAKAIEKSTEVFAKAAEMRAEAMASNARTKQYEAPTRVRSREVFSNMMSDPNYVYKRREQNRYEAERYRLGIQEEEDRVNLELKKQRVEAQRLSLNRQGYSRFTTENQLREQLRELTNSWSHRNGVTGFFSRIGAQINPYEVFSKKDVRGVELGRTGVSVGAFAGGAFGLALQKATEALMKFSQASLDAYGVMSKLETSLGVVYGSQGQASAVFSEISEYATKSPFGVEQMTEMAILLKQSGIYESDLMDTLQTIGDLAGGNEEKYRRIANNYAQVLAIGKATTKDMREFANAGIPIFEATANYLGIDRKALSDEIQKGNVTGQVLEAVFKQLTGEGGLFYKATEKGSETYAARTVNVQDLKQLALSEWGEALYQGSLFGTYGEDSLVKSFLDIEEKFLGFVKNWGENKNSKEALKALRESKDVASESLSQIIELQQFLGNGVSLTDSTIKNLGDQIKEAKNTFSKEEEVRILSDAYDVEKQRIEDRYGSITGDAGSIRNQIEALQSEFVDIQQQRFNSTDFDESTKLLAREEQLVVEIAKLVNANQALLDKDTAMSNLRNSDMMYGKTITLLEGISRQSADSLDKNLNYNTNSLLNLSTVIDELYKNTDEYAEKQKEAVKDQIEQVDKLIKQAKEYDLQNNLAFVKGKDLNTVQDILSTFYSGSSIIDSNGITVGDAKTVKSNIDYMLEMSLSDDQKDFLNKLSVMVTDIGNNTNSQTLVSDLGKLISDNEKRFADLIGMAFVKYEQTTPTEHLEAVSKELKDEEYAKTIPFWAKIAGNAFDVEPLKLKWTAYHTDEDTNHGYGVKTYYTGDYDNPIFRERGGNRGSMMYRNGVEALLGVTGSKYLQDLVFATDKDGNIIRSSIGGSRDVAQYDWNKSFQSLERIALSLDSTVEMTSTLANFYQQQSDKFSSYITSGIIGKEDWSLIQSKEYKENLGYAGEDFDRLLNALSAETEVLEDGSVRIKSAGIRYATEIENLLEPTKVLSSQFNSLKSSLAGIVTSTEQTQLRGYAVNNNLFGSKLTLEQQVSLADTAYSVIKEELDSLGLDREARDAYLSQSAKFIEAAVSGNTKGFTEQELALTNAIVEMIATTKENTNALIGFDISKNLQSIGKEGSLSFDMMSVITKGSIGVTDSFGNSAKQQRILGSLGISGRSYDEVTKALKDSQNESVLSDIQNSVSQATGLDATNMSMDELLDKFSLLTEASKQFDLSMSNVANGSLQALLGFATGGIQSTFEEIGKSLVTSESASENIANAWKDLGKNLASQISTLLITEGLRIMGSAAIGPVFDWGRFGIGAAMVAAGGLGGILTGVLSASENDQDKTQEEVEKLRSIKDMLSDLLAQARIDAEYYEKNLRHQYAISANEALSSYTKVNDAVITPSGNVISTHPDDWLIATKTPHELGGGSAPVVTITIVNESGDTVKVARTEKTQNGNNIDIKAIVVATMNEAVADGSLDSGLAAYQQRQRGRSVIY